MVLKGFTSSWLSPPSSRLHSSQSLLLPSSSPTPSLFISSSWSTSHSHSSPYSSSSSFPTSPSDLWNSIKTALIENNPLRSGIGGGKGEGIKKLFSPANLLSMTILTTSFYTLQILNQRFLFNRLGLHSGRMNSLLTPIGALSTLSTLFLSQNLELIIRKQYLPEYVTIPGWDYSIPLKSSPPPSSSFSSLSSSASLATRREERKDFMKRLLVGWTTFLVLENQHFRTCFPSSIISLGVFGHLKHRWKRSVETDSPSTTPAQRAEIQLLGKKYGCHQCGSRQLGLSWLWRRKGGMKNSNSFIADHMPPTKIAELESKKWWRRLFKSKVPQRLWPQCQNCYSLQGSAVKAGKHVLAYHYVFKKYHLSPAIAFLLVQEPTISQYLDKLCNPLLDWIEDRFEDLETTLKRKKVAFLSHNPKS